jgi:hypothetical protein
MLHPFRDSNPTYMLLSLPVHPAGQHSKRITAEGQTRLPSNGCIESDPTETFYLDLGIWSPGRFRYSTSVSRPRDSRATAIPKRWATTRDLGLSSYPCDSA